MDNSVGRHKLNLVELVRHRRFSWQDALECPAQSSLGHTRLLEAVDALHLIVVAIVVTRCAAWQRGQEGAAGPALCV